MENTLLRDAAKRYRPFPIGAFLGLVFAVCAGLAISAVYGYITLSRLRTQYLQNLGHEIAGAIDAQARGPGRRNNPAFWQSLIEEKFRGFDSSAAFVSLLDQSGKVLAGKSHLDQADLAAPPGYTVAGGASIYVFDLSLVPARQGQFGMSAQISGWRVRVGLYTATADFIQRQAVIQVLVTSVAVLTLLVLAYYLLQMLQRFIELKNREQSERHLTALGTMSAALAHEIRNPLGAMKGLTQLVQEDLPKDHGAQALMQTVVGEAERLEALVSDLLSFARPRQPSLNEFDYAHLLRDVKAMLEPKLQEADKSLELTVRPEPFMIHSDEHSLRQVLLNTLLNAVDFTPRGGKIILRARREEGGRTIVTEIDDSGPGIGDRDPEELFEPFVTTKTKGTGLGLAVSRRIVEGLGGTIRLDNLGAAGARCTIRLPERER